MRPSRAICAPTFVVAGALHFVSPNIYRRLVSSYLRAPRALVRSAMRSDASRTGVREE